MTPTLFALLDLLLVFVAVAAFGWWQLRDVKRAQRESKAARDAESGPP